MPKMFPMKMKIPVLAATLATTLGVSAAAADFRYAAGEAAEGRVAFADAYDALPDVPQTIDLFLVEDLDGGESQLADLGLSGYSLTVTVDGDAQITDFTFGPSFSGSFFSEFEVLDTGSGQAAGASAFGGSLDFGQDVVVDGEVARAALLGTLTIAPGGGSSSFEIVQGLESIAFQGDTVLGDPPVTISPATGAFVVAVPEPTLAALAAGPLLLLRRRRN